MNVDMVIRILPVISRPVMHDWILIRRGLLVEMHGLLMKIYKIACLKMEINDLVMQRYCLENLFVIPVVMMEDEEDEISLAHVAQ